MIILSTITVDTLGKQFEEESGHISSNDNSPKKDVTATSVIEIETTAETTHTSVVDGINNTPGNDEL